MKFIGHLQGFAVFREPMEEYAADKQPPISELIQFISSSYQFASYPVLRPGAALPTTFNFMGGRFPEEGNHFSINQLVMAAETDLAVTSSAYQSDLVLNHLITTLDETFGFRLRSSRITKSYVSNIVVEFERGIEEFIQKLARMEAAINEKRNPKLPRLKFKRLGFGAKGGTPAETDPISAVEEAEFLIERRAGSPFEQNRYFCSAPMLTDDHLRVLEVIEMIARTDGC